MKFVLVVIFLVLGTVYSRSIPVKSSDIVDSVNLNPIPLIRKVRQYGVGYNNFDYNPYNDTPNNYDANPFNDSAHRQTYNNFDWNPFNNSPNNYDLNPFNNSNFFGKKK